MDTRLTRRELVRRTALIAAVPALVSTSARAEEALLEENNPAAVALGYKHNADAVDAAKFPKRSGAEGARQLCLNCSLYQPKTDALGGCAIFPGQNVAARGWCNAWVPNA